MNAALRLATQADLAQIQAIYAPFCGEDSAVSFEVVPPDVAEIGRRVAAILPGYPWLVCEVDDAIAGYAYAGPHGGRAGYRWSVSTAIYIAAGQRRAGVGRALYTSLLAILRLQGFASAFAGTTLPNPASIGLHRAMGFEPVGVYRDVGYVGGIWLDTAWWQVSLCGRMVAPEPPLSLEAVLDTPGWNEAIAAGLACLRVR